MDRKRATASNGNGRADTGCPACGSYRSGLCHALTQLAGDDGAPVFQPQDHMIAARRVICRENEAVDRVPIICQGWAATVVTLSDNRRQILSFLLPGDIVSSLLIFEPVIRCSVEAITELRYRTFARAELKAALLGDPGLMDMVYRIRHEETERADQLAMDLGRRTASERIAKFILDLSERLAQRGLMRDGAMDFPLRQHHIADATGLTVVHAGNVLSEFRRAGYIEINDRSLTLGDPVALRRVAGMI